LYCINDVMVRPSSAHVEEYKRMLSNSLPHHGAGRAGRAGFGRGLTRGIRGNRLTRLSVFDRETEQPTVHPVHPVHPVPQPVKISQPVVDIRSWAKMQPVSQPLPQAEKSHSPPVSLADAPSASRKRRQIRLKKSLHTQRNSRSLVSRRVNSPNPPPSNRQLSPHKIRQKRLRGSRFHKLVKLRYVK
jgi:hypothetical protein